MIKPTIIKSGILYSVDFSKCDRDGFLKYWRLINNEMKERLVDDVSDIPIEVIENIIEGNPVKRD